MRTCRILFAARPAIEKGLLDLLEALDMLGDQHWKLTVIGEPAPGAAERVAGSPVLASRVMLAGSCMHAEMPKIMRRHDVVVVPSHYETFGNIALEAMACARLVIASRTGGLAEIVIDGRTGLHFEPRNSEELAAKLRLVIADLEAWKELGKNARSHAVRFSWNRIAAETEELFERVIAAQHTVDRHAEI
jgi:glycosyltransferase involved in cell wall biosynthesis